MKAFSAVALAALVAILFLVSGCTQPSGGTAQTPTPAGSDCNALEKEIMQGIGEANHCEKDEDCNCVSLACPFGCFKCLNKNEDISGTNGKIEEYLQKCPSCLYDCDKMPTEFQCIEGKCYEKAENYCNGEIPMDDEERQNCTCPAGMKKFDCMFAPYCATDSGKECKSTEDCPRGESCISADGKAWSCSGIICGCWHRDPQNPTAEICAD